MPLYIPSNLEQIPAFDEVSWSGDPDDPLLDIPALQINKAGHAYIPQGELLEVDASSHVNFLASGGFTVCSAFIMRNEVTHADTFCHFWPGSGSSMNRLGRYLQSQNNEALKSAVHVYGARSNGIDHFSSLSLLAAQRARATIRSRAISIETGSSWWSAVFDRAAGELYVLRREPEQTMVRYKIFE